MWNPFRSKPIPIKKVIASLPEDGEVPDKLMMCVVRVHDLYARHVERQLSTKDRMLIKSYKSVIAQFDHPPPQNLKEAKVLRRYLEGK